MYLLDSIDTSHEDLLEQRRRLKLQLSAAAVVAGLAILVGAVFYRIVEDLRWIDSLYFTVVTLTTVGYGDITPQTDIGKLFTVGYIFVGIGIIATFANLIFRVTVAKRMLKAYDKQQKAKTESKKQ